MGTLSPGVSKPHHTVNVDLTPIPLATGMSRWLSGLALTPEEEHTFPPVPTTQDWPSGPCQQRQKVQHPVISSPLLGKRPCRAGTQDSASRLHTVCHEVQPARRGPQESEGDLRGRAAPRDQWPRLHRAQPMTFAGPAVLLPKPTALIKFKLLILKEREGRITSSQVRFIELLEGACPFLCPPHPPNERGS